ncbi:LemA family protein [Aquimarina megaterium]|uniref:LemA family protein n=1 Tax=Aquimarina megaterium TaxID=1443666 RepID=UPI00094506F1|nr:LemA family protein [Aquimarina megaterium]
MTVIYITICIVLFLIIGFIISYNTISTRRNQIENAISSLDALFIKRYDLIPNLVNVVKEYMDFEEETLKKITAMRTLPNDSIKESEASNLLKGLMVQVENYPELKANTQFTNLQFSLNEVEEQISAGRRYISTSITDYNNAIVIFPSNIVASITGFKNYEWHYANKTQQTSIDTKTLFKQS